jgi:HK97 family phage portal protein
LFEALTRYFRKQQSLRSMVHPSGGVSFFSLLSRTKYDYAGDVGDGTNSSTIMAPVQWIQRNFPEAPIMVSEKGPEKPEKVEGHPLTALLNHPNDSYGDAQLWMGTIFSWCVAGNAYWLKIRNRLGDVVQLWYVPHWMIKPARPTTVNSKIFISHYEYRPGGDTIDIPVEDVVHFRHGIDPNNPQLGIAPLHSVMREVWSDDEASNWVAALLRNSGVPGLVVSPEGNAMVAPGDPDLVRQYIKDMFSGDRRGDPLVMGGPTKVQQFGYDPKNMDLTTVRNTAEERSCSSLGIPAAVVGFGTGLENSKVGAPQPLSARLWTPRGPTTMGAIRAGDTIGIPGGWGQVRQVFPQGEQDIYRITFQDDSTAESTPDHLWQIHTLQQKTDWEIVPLSKIASWSDWTLRRTTVPLQGVTHFAEQDVLIPPYVMGLLLADGTFRNNLAFSNSNLQIVDSIREQVGPAYAVNAVNQKYAGGIDYRIAYRDYHRARGKGHGLSGNGPLNPFIEELRSLGLWMKGSPEKFVPDLYKYNSARIRLQLLQGIFDGDGFVNQHGQPAIDQTSQRLADDITEIVQSLGGYTLRHLKKANRNTRFIKGRAMASRHDMARLSIVIADAASLFSCDEKRDRCRPRTKAPTRKIRKIEFARREQAQCIQVDGGLYLTDNFIVTHNTMYEFTRMAWTDGIVPIQRIMASEVSRSLLPDFEDDPDEFEVGFDYSNVKALQDNQTDLFERANIGVTGGWITVSQAKRMVNLVPEPEDDIYLRPFGVVEVPLGVSRDMIVLPPARDLAQLPAPNADENDDEVDDEEEDGEEDSKGGKVRTLSDRRSKNSKQKIANPKTAKARFVDVEPGDESYRLIHAVADRFFTETWQTYFDIVDEAKNRLNLAALQTVLSQHDSSVALNFLFVSLDRLREDLEGRGHFLIRKGLTGIYIRIFDLAARTEARHLDQVLGKSTGLESVKHAAVASIVAANGGSRTKADPPAASLQATFNLTNPRAVQTIQQSVATLITEINGGQRDAVRAIIERAFEVGLPPPQSARLIRDVIGLTSRQAQAVGKFELNLIEQGLAEDVIERRVERFAHAQLRRRSMDISRTETINAANYGQRELWKQGIDDGVLPGTQKRKWLVSPDDRLDEIVCEPMSGQIVGVDEPFITGDGRQVMNPGGEAHPK